MEEMINYLIRIGFSRLESQIYLNLLQSKGLTGYQIAKNLDISRSSVYPALEAMYKKGYILLVEGEALTYVAEDSTILISRLKGEYESNSLMLIKQLKTINVASNEERFINIQGFDQMITKAKELLRGATKEVIINTNGGIDYLYEDIQQVIKRGVRVIIFSFMDLNLRGLDVEFYTHKHPYNNEFTRIMLVVDFKNTIVADTYEGRPLWVGVLTNNTLLTSIICEHIHHDIYLLLMQETDKVLIRPYLLNSLLETSGRKM